jgi:hypothetical protein
MSYWRDIGKVPWSQDSALVTIPQLQEPFGNEKDIVSLVVKVETRGVGQHRGALEDGNGTSGLLG